jgi:AraC-like DNA-binding protein
LPNYTTTQLIDELASHVQMSPSSLHQYFRQLTAMSPLQYQKWSRLNEARRLMLNEDLDAASAAFEVGYESPSQFSREYTQLFGTPPKRDIGEHDEVAPPAVMEQRIAQLRRAGTEVEYRKFKDLGHGFGPGTGTSAEGWINEATRFWARSIRK